jgi:hypothetical protein
VDVLRGVHDDLLCYYETKPEDAGALIATGESKPAPGLEPKLLATWTLLANSLMNLDETLNK